MRSSRRHPWLYRRSCKRSHWYTPEPPRCHRHCRHRRLMDNLRCRYRGHRSRLHRGQRHRRHCHRRRPQRNFHCRCPVRHNSLRKGRCRRRRHHCHRQQHMHPRKLRGHRFGFRCNRNLRLESQSIRSRKWRLGHCTCRRRLKCLHRDPHRHRFHHCLNLPCTLPRKH